MHFLIAQKHPHICIIPKYLHNHEMYTVSPPLFVVGFLRRWISTVTSGKTVVSRNFNERTLLISYTMPRAMHFMCMTRELLFLLYI